MRMLACSLLISMIPFFGFSQERLPIIDMHLHAHSVAGFSFLISPPPIPHCVPMASYPEPQPGTTWREIFSDPNPPCEAIWSPMNDEELMARTFELLEKHHIVAAVTSGPHTNTWRQISPGRIIPALDFSPLPDAPPVDSLRAWYNRGEFSVLGEITPQYDGYRADGPEMEPIWALAEELGFPVNIHIGPGPVGAPYLVWPNYRASLHSPLQLEEVLMKHPDLRISIGHAAWPMLDELLALMWTHPQAYVDIAVINWALPRKEFHRYLQRIVESGFGKRVLFGSDQMVWPDAIEIAIDAIETADFLSQGQKRDIFYNNAARFLRLSDEEIATHHAASANSTNGTEITKLKRVSFDGTEIHYTEQGSGEPVVMIHGSLADYSYWENSNQIEPLSVYHHVISYSRRYNHPNQNEPGMSHSPIVEAEDLTRLLEALDTGPVHLVGHSYGAYTALVFALEHPGKVRSLVLAEPPILPWLPDIPGGEGIEEGFMAGVWHPMAEAFRESDEAGLEFTSQWYFRLPFSEIEPDWQTLFQNNVKEWRALAFSPETFPKVDYERVKAMQISVLLLSGGKNAGGFNDLIDGHLERLIPGAERIVIPDSSHEMFLDFPEVTATTMLEFFRKHSP